ncbi:MAG: transglycosylase SLT domain-containing protein [Desulfobacterium sp.]|jgi:LysM repeat protein|nr:transglycosylase SLT domain-containing protein [Desulfobacterium sp.]
MADFVTFPRWAVFFTVLFLFFPSPCPVNGSDLPDRVIPSLVESVRLPDPLFFCEDKVPVEDFDVRERLEKEVLLALWDRAQVILWLKRASRYFPHIESVLKKEGLPDDLKYIAVIESGLRPHAGSSMGAVGFWQFLRSTGRNQGLKVDSTVDERRNIFTSTQAACQYLKTLKELFGSWSLAAAAYNMGENGLAAEIKKQGTADYYSLYLPLETQGYVLKIVAAKEIMKNPEKYGFILSGEDYYPQLSFDSIDMVSDCEIPVAVIAQAAGTSFKEIKNLNPDIRGDFVAEGRRTILIPAQRSEEFSGRLPGLVKAWKEKSGTALHVVKKGDSLTTIAQQYQMSLGELLRLNRLTLSSLIHPGDRLKVDSKL